MKFSQLESKLKEINIPFISYNCNEDIEILPSNCIVINGLKIKKNNAANKVLILFIFNYQNIIDNFCRIYDEIDARLLIIIDWNNDKKDEKKDLFLSKFSCPIIFIKGHLSYVNFVHLIDDNIDSVSDEILNKFRTDLSNLYEDALCTTENIMNLLHIYIGTPITLLSEDLDVLNWISYANIFDESIIENLSNFIKSNKDIIQLSNNYSCFQYRNQKIIVNKLQIGHCLLGYLFTTLNNISDSFINKIIMNLIPYLSIAIMSHQKNEFILRRPKDEFIKGLVLGMYDDEATIIRESGFYNLEYYSSNFIWILEVIDNTKFDKKTHSSQKDINLILEVASRYFEQNLFFYHTNKVISIHRKGNEPNSKIKNKFENLLKNLKFQFLRYDFNIGISRAYENLGQLKFAYNDAIFSLQIGSQFYKSEDRILYYDDIILYHFVISIINNPIVIRIYNNTILKLEQYDKEEDGDMIETLSTLIENNYNIMETASKLFIHRNTLYNKIKKLRKLLIKISIMLIQSYYCN